MAMPVLDPFPETGFLIETIDFGAAEIGGRDNTHNLAVLNDRHVAAADIVHEAESVEGRTLWRHRSWLFGHYVGEERLFAILALGENATDGIAPGEDAK